MMPLAGIGGGMAAVADRVQDLDPRAALLAVALQVVTLGLRALAWRGVLAAAYPERRLPVFPLACAYTAGVALNAFLPARGGEAAKVALARAQIPGSSLPTIAGSLAVIALLDAFLSAALVAALWAGGLLPELPPLPSVPGGALVLLLLGAGVLGTVLLGLAARGFAAALVRMLASAAHGLVILRAPSRLLRTVIPFQLAAWAARVGVAYFVLVSFRIDAGLETAILLTVLSGAALPVPGGAGSQQVFAAYALQGAISTAASVSFSISMQLGVTLVNTVVGLVGAMLLFRTHRPLAALRAARAR
ncbi:MAG: lysylphosphatidylglycerol synthase domain-containing protein [Gaiellaceae bacterium]